MFFGAAEAKTSAGAPLVIWVARVELAPKLNLTVSPGWASWNCFPSWVKVSFSDDAANTVIVPAGKAEPPAAAGDELVPLGADVGLLLEQPAAVSAASAATVRAKRRMFTPGWVWARAGYGLGLVLAGLDQLVPGISTETLVALTAATASIP